MTAVKAIGIKKLILAKTTKPIKTSGKINMQQAINAKIVLAFDLSAPEATISYVLAKT